MLQTKGSSPSCPLATKTVKRVLLITLRSNPKSNVGTGTASRTTLSGYFHAQSVLGVLQHLSLAEFTSLKEVSSSKQATKCLVNCAD